jgi:hypothetical protein
VRGASKTAEAVRRRQWVLVAVRGEHVPALNGSPRRIAMSAAFTLATFLPVIKKLEWN